MFSYADLRRAEIAIALTDRHGLPFAEDSVFDAWQTVGDVIGYITAHAQPGVSASHALEWVRDLFAFGWDVPRAEVTPEEPLFGPVLRLDCRDFFHDLAVPPRTDGATRPG
jgi:hypothetical protein